MPDDLSPERFRARISEVCEELLAQTGDDRFARAAGVLRGKPGGRPEKDDEAALAYAESLFEAGFEPSKNAACVRAATMYSPTRIEIDATRARLAKKFGRK
jgi:hypothetical protein